ncbi:MAG: hypothetical protein N2Z20_03250 [Elusimicrobiales bacterium]|nr:hypothetical protein [Elusimicrobiales bacterium]
MKKMISLLLLVSITNVYAKDVRNDKKYFTITDVKISILEETGINKGGGIPLNPVPPPSQLPKPPELPQSPLPNSGSDPSQILNNVNSVIDTLDKIVNLAQKIWDIIEKNQPVVNISVNYANAIPYGLQHWTQLQGWSKPKTLKYSFVAKNGYGAEVVKVVYQVHATYGGNYQGKGKFLTGVTVEPISVETAWGYKVSLVAEVPDSTIANVGTHEDPIASMKVHLRWKIHTMIKDLQQQAIYYVDGTGKIEEIASPFKKSTEIKSLKVEPVEIKKDEVTLPVVEKIKSADF